MLLALIASVVSVIALVGYYRHDAILIYGDAVAHINIARRVFDSRWPGPSQLGTVWLPVPHILMLPFVISNWAWRTGIGGSIPSMFGYVAGVLGVFRLLRRGLGAIGASDGRARTASWFGALVYAANPNLIYLQSTAMGESLYLAFFIWATVFFADFVQNVRGGSQSEFSHLGGAFGRHPMGAEEDSRGAAKSLSLCGVMLLCCELSRYDGWFAVACFGAVTVLVVLASSFRALGQMEWKPAIRGGFIVFLLLVAAGPAFWLGWNKYYFGNALEWLNGPYSARAIMMRSMKNNPPHPGYHDVKTAAVYYVKCAKLNLAGRNLEWGGARYGWPKIVETTWPVLTIAGTVCVLLMGRAMWPLLLLWVPLPFYAISIAYGGVPIFMPVWWPYSFYNVRYGLQVLPAAAVFVALAVYFFSEAVRKRALQVAVAGAAVLFVSVSYAWIWQSGPVCLHEPQSNSVARIELEREVASELNRLPQNSTFLMQIGYYVGVLERGGIPLKRTINESSFELWQKTLADPARYADYLVAAGQDRVALAAEQHADEFEPIAKFEAQGEPTVTVYRKKAMFALPGATAPGASR